MRRRRRLRWRLVLGLAIALAAIAGAAIAVQKVQSRRAALAFKSQAFEAAERGDAEQAIKLMQFYLVRFRQDSESVRDLALQLEKNARLPRDQIRILGFVEQALILNPGDIKTRQLAARKALELHKFSAAREHLHLLAAALPHDAMVERQLGECDEGEQKLESATAHYSRAIELDSREVEAYVRQAHLLRTRLNQKDRADAVMFDLGKANPDSVPALLARARYFGEIGRPGDAEGDIEHALSLAGDSAEVRFLAAENALALNHPDAAEKHLSAGLKTNPNHLPSIRLLSELRKRNPKTSDGREIRALVIGTLKTLEENPRRSADVLELLIDLNELAEARKLLNTAKSDWLPSYARDFLEARLRMAEEDFAGARKLLERCRPQLATVQALARVNHLLLGICERKLRDLTQAATSLRTALDISPDWAPAQLELAAVDTERGQFEEALGLYRRLMGEIPDARFAVIRLMLERIRRQQPDARDWKAIENLLAEAPESLKKSSDWRLMQSEILLAQGNAKEARAVLVEAIRTEPMQLSYRLALADLELQQKQSPKAAEILDHAEKLSGDRIEIRLARANFAVRLPATEAVAALAKLASSTEQFSRPQRIRLFAGLYRLAVGVDRRFARRIGEKLAEMQPSRLDLRFGLLRLALADNDEAAARAQIAKLREIEGDGGVYWRCGDVAMKLQFSRADDRSWIAEARARLVDAAQARPDWSLPVLLLGELDDREGKKISALQNFRSAIELGEHSPAVVRRTVQLLQALSRFEEAQELLRRLAGKWALDAELGKMALPALIGREPPEQILDEARKLISEDSRDYRDHLWLGQLLAALGGKPADAEKSFRRAVELAPEAGEAWVGLVFFLASSGQRTKAESVLADAEQKLKSPETAASLAVCHEAVGQTAKAEACLLEAAGKKPDDARIQRGLASLFLHSGDIKKAEPILERLSQMNSAEAGWARRQRAIILIQTGPYFFRIREAIRLIEQNLKSAGAGPEDQRAEAILLALQPFKRAEAIRALELSFKVLPATGDEQVLLARLYEGARNWPAARERLLAVASGTPAPRHLEYFAGRLLIHGDLPAAARWIEQLEKLDPESLRTAALKARLLVRLDKADEARDLLRKFMLAASDPEQLILIGRLMEEVGLFDSAEQAYRRYSLRMKGKNGPSADLPLARFFALRGRGDEALKIIDAVGGAAPPHAAYSVVSAMVRSPKLQPEQLNRLENWIKAIQQKSPDAVPLFLALAEISEHRLQSDEALAAYDRILAKEPNNIAALNNSAMVLALTNRAGEAKARVDRAIVLAGLMPPLLDTRALAQLAGNNSSAAIADLEEALAQEESAVRRFHLALAQKAAGDHQAFAGNIQKAKDLKLVESSLHPLEREKWRDLK